MDIGYKDVISIIVPMYNAERVIERCINSIMRQSYKNWELIIIDDGSYDNSYKLCMKYAQLNSRIKVYKQENGGVSVARNSGIKKSTGNWVCFVDADDAVGECLLEKMCEAKEEADADFVICGMTKNGIEQKPEERLLIGEKEIVNYVQEHYLQWVISSPWGKLYRKEQLPEKGFDESISLGEDLKFNIEYFATCNKVKIIEDALYFYYDNEGSLTKVYKERNYEAILEIYKKTKQYIENINGEENQLFKNVNYKLFSFCISFMSQNMKRGNRKQQLQFIETIVKEPLLQSAVNNLPELSITRKVYVKAIKAKSVEWLYILSWIKFRFIDKY